MNRTAMIQLSSNAIITIFADGKPVKSTDKCNGSFRIRPIKARRWSFVIQATSNVRGIRLAESVQELSDGE